MVGIITRGDGIIFSIKNSRHYGLGKKSRKNFEVGLSKILGIDVNYSEKRYCLAPDNSNILAIVGSSGYSLGESVQRKLNSDNFLFIEKYNGLHIIVVCEDGRISADTCFENELPVGILFLVKSISVKLDLFAYGDVNRIVESFSGQFSTKQNINTESLVDGLDTWGDLYLNPWKDAVGKSGIFRAEKYSKVSLALLVGFAIIFFLFKAWFSPGEVGLDFKAQEQQKLLAEYQQLVTKSNIYDGVLIGSKVLSDVNEANGWGYRDVILNSDGVVEINFIPFIAGFSPDIESLIRWAGQYGYKLNFASSSEVKALKTIVMPRSVPVEMNLEFIVVGTARSVNGSSLSVKFEAPVSMGIYTTQKALITAEDTLPESVALAVAPLKRMPVAFSFIKWERKESFYDMSAEIGLIAKN